MLVTLPAIGRFAKVLKFYVIRFLRFGAIKGLSKAKRNTCSVVLMPLLKKGLILIQV